MADLSGLAPPPLCVQLLGRFEVWRHGAPIPAAEWRGQKTRDLLKILLLSDRRFVAKDQLVEWLWPGAGPARACPAAPGWETNLDKWKALTDTLMRAGHVTKASGRAGGTFLTKGRMLYQLLAAALDGSLPLRAVEVVEDANVGPNVT